MIMTNPKERERRRILAGASDFGRNRTVYCGGTRKIEVAPGSLAVGFRCSIRASAVHCDYSQRHKPRKCALDRHSLVGDFNSSDHVFFVSLGWPKQ